MDLKKRINHVNIVLLTLVTVLILVNCHDASLSKRPIIPVYKSKVKYAMFVFVFVLFFFLSFFLFVTLCKL